MKPFTIALAGNPNCGKTVLFNALTGSSQRVGNWPGVTVERKTGSFLINEKTLHVVDIPGTYALSVTSESAIDEKIACSFLLSKEVDLIVNVLDGSNLERNLYLTLQLLEMKIPMILAVNMMDIVAQQGIQLDLKKLSKILDCPVVELIAAKGSGVDLLKKTIFDFQTQPTLSQFQLPLPLDVQQSLQGLTKIVKSAWLALRILEQDQWARTQVEETIYQAAIKDEKKDFDIVIADARYRLAQQITQEISTQTKIKKQKTLTQTIDRIILNRFLGIPIFLCVMYLMFIFAINLGGAFQDFFDQTSTILFIQGPTHLLTQWHAPSWLIALIANGIGTGINTVVTFVPIIGAMFLFLAFLEDCGYMARAAFVMDRCMRALGLPGKSFVPMIVGFGCNVPAVMGARTLANRRDRVLTVMMMPFMSCGARLAIFAVFASTFFAHSGAFIIFLLYLLGIIVAILTGLILRKTILSGDPAPLIMELPPYHLPRISAISRHAWQRLQGFLIRAGKYIIPICLLIGVLNSITLQGKFVGQNAGQKTLLSSVGKIFTPLLAPMGIQQDNWPATVGLTTGILTKEVVIGTLNTLYGELSHTKKTAMNTLNFWTDLKEAVKSIPSNLAELGKALKNPVLAEAPAHDMEENAANTMFHHFDGKIGAFAYLLFVLLYFPCISTLAAMRREIGNRWSNFSMIWTTSLAYCLAVICYQALTIMRHPWSSVIWCGSLLFLLAVGIFSLRYFALDDPNTTLTITSKKDSSCCSN